MAYVFSELAQADPYAAVGCQKVGPFPTQGEATVALCPSGMADGGGSGGQGQYYKICCLPSPSTTDVRALSFPSEPRVASDCPQGSLLIASTTGGTRTSPHRIPARCLRCQATSGTRPCPTTGVPGTGTLATARCVPSERPDRNGNCPAGRKLQAGCCIPPTSGADCPAGYSFQAAGLYGGDVGLPARCNPPRPHTCYPTSGGAPISVAALLPCPSGTVSTPTVGVDFFFSNTPCPQGYVKEKAGTKSEGCRRLSTMSDGPGLFLPPLVKPNGFIPPTPPGVECQTGYVLVANQCVKQDVPPTQVDVEVKTAGTPNWVSENWKWLLALAAAGGVVYWWTKRKAV